MSNVNSNPCNCEPACTTCGRPWVVCKGDCGCKKSCCNNVNFCEYGKKVSSCFRSVEPSCPMQAVIPSVVVENISGLKHLADCLVHVTNINTTFYIDDKHRTMITWAGPVEYDNYDLDANTLGLRSQFLIDHANDYAAYYNKTGGYQKFNFSEDNGGNALSFTMQYDVGTQAHPLPGWIQGRPTEVLLGISPSSTLYKMDNIYYGGNTHPVTFLNDSTGEVITPEALYALLLDGADVTLNHVPLGIVWQPEWGDLTPYADGVHLTKFHSRAELGGESYGIVGFGGSAFVCVVPPNTEDYISAQLGFTIIGLTPIGGSTDSVPEYEHISAQCFYENNLN